MKHLKLFNFSYMLFTIIMVQGTFKLTGSNMSVQTVRQAIINAINFLGVKYFWNSPPAPWLGCLELLVLKSHSIISCVLLRLLRGIWMTYPGLKFCLMHFTGQAVMKAAKNGMTFPLKRRDIMLDYVISLMTTNDSDSLRTQEKLWISWYLWNLLQIFLVEYVLLPVLQPFHVSMSLFTSNCTEVIFWWTSILQETAINVCSTLVSVEPRLTTEMRDHVLQVGEIAGST
jgi:hypothetical protein